MGNIVCCIPADNEGNKLWIKDFREDKGRLFVNYKSTYNDIPFIETEIFIVDGSQNVAITSDNGTIIFRFSIHWLKKLIEDE
jgi:hypothetical protein